MSSIAVYAGWGGIGGPTRLGWIHLRQGGARELFEFELDEGALEDPAFAGLHLDPRIGWYPGRQHPPHGFATFGLFSDASPDRWGRLLMRRRLEREQRAGLVDKSARLRESDYLLGVHDSFRVGGLRFRLEDAGAFLDDRHGMAAPPLVRLRELEAASLALERDTENSAPEGDDWLKMLLAPGGSLGGARPKASVTDPEGGLWIAKFPSAGDLHDVGGWEMVVNTLAHQCGLSVPEVMVQRFSGPHHTFLVKRFDREGERRLHFASAMTLTGHKDGEDGSVGVSYLELAQVLVKEGAEVERDLRELWSRVVFNVLVSNADDHLRNHGFLLRPGRGWSLSPAYDLNPVPMAQGLKLNISEADNALELALALEVAQFFRVGAREASEIVARFKGVVRGWRAIAARLSLPRREQERLSDAFRASEN